MYLRASSVASQMFVDCLQSHFLKQHVTTNTRKHSLLDLVFTNDPNMIDNVNVLGTFGTCDHNMLQWDANVGTTKFYASRTVLDYRKGDFSAMKNELSKVPWNKVLPGST